MVTVEDVAREAGVSVATVSRVVNKSPLVSPETTNKVNAVIERLHYKPNIFGRGLRRKESHIVLIIIPNITNPYYSQIVSGIESVCHRSNYITMLCITEASQIKASSYLEFLKNGTADGAIILSTEKNDLNLPELAKHYPIVQCSEYCNDDAISHVSIDNFEAAIRVIEYLISINHKRIGFISSYNQFISTELRQNGYLEAMTSAGFNFGNHYIAYADSDYSFVSGQRAARELLERKDRPSAIFCVSDIIALGAISAARELNLCIPEDVSIVGFDNVEYATMFTPKLTTVSQPCYSLGVNSAELILKQLAGGKEGGNIFLEYDIILRESTALVKS